MKTVSNIIHHWDFDKCTERMNRPDAAHTNPVVAKTNAIVLCLHCFGDNSDQFKFCQHCGKQPSQTLKGVSAVRLFGSQGSAQLNPKMKLNIADKFNSFLAYKATSQNSKAIVSIMKSLRIRKVFVLIWLVKICQLPNSHACAMC